MKAVPAADKPAITPIVLLYAHCNNTIFDAALKKLDAYTGFKHKPDMYAFNKIKDTYDRKTKSVRRDFTKLVNSHAILVGVTEKDKEGKERPKKDPATGRQIMRPKMEMNKQTGQIDWLMKDEAAFQKDLKALMANTFEIKAQRLKTEDLMAAGLTPQEVRACSRIVVDGEADQDQEAILDDDEQDDGIDPLLLGDPVPDDVETPPAPAPAPEPTPET